MRLRPVAYATGLTLSRDGKLNILPTTDLTNQIVIMERPGIDTVRWSINPGLGHDSCLNRDGNWEYEPLPSSRTEDFYARCRFGTFMEAVEFLEAKAAS